MADSPVSTIPDLLEPCKDGEERKSCTHIDPGFHIRHPPPPHDLTSFQTPDSLLFQTIHMGPATVDPTSYLLTITGLVSRPFSITLPTLLSLPKVTITSFHECYGSPLKPPTTNVWRIGNVTWTGVRLSTLLTLAHPLPSAKYVHSDGLDSGTFDNTYSDRYQKDLPLDKAWRDEVLVAYEMNGEPLSKLRGGPVRLVVPGWFGTNSTKWLCRIHLAGERAGGLYTTRLYNEVYRGTRRPVWEVEPNSLIVRPQEGEVRRGGEVRVEGWAWGGEEIERVAVSVDGGKRWEDAVVTHRKEFEWQRFEVVLQLGQGKHSIMARAHTKSGLVQPLSGRRNHVHTVAIELIC